MKICIDPGHGDEDPGAIGGGLLEKNKNLEVAKQAYGLLTSDGHDVKMTRDDDTFVSLADRAKISNDFGADIFISIHHNAGGGSGFEIIHSILGGKGEHLAHCLAQEYRKIGLVPHPMGTDGTYSRKGNNGDYYAVVRLTKAVAIISEAAYIDNPKDRALMTGATWAIDTARAIMLAVREYENGTKDN